MDGVLPEGEEDNEDLIEEEINSEDEQWYILLILLHICYLIYLCIGLKTI